MRRVLIICFVLLLLCNATWLIYAVQQEGFDHVEPLNKDEPYRILEEENVPRAELSSFQATDTMLALYYDSEGLVNVYSLEGTFLYGVQIPTIRNGYGDFVYSDNILYIISRENRIYAFKNLELERSFVCEDSPDEFVFLEKLAAEDKNHSVDSDTFYYLAASNQIKKSNALGVTETVISLPKHNKNIRSIAFSILIITAAFSHYLKHSKQTA